MTDFSDPGQVKKAKQRAREKERDKQTVIAALMEHQQGRDFLFELLSSCGIFHSVFDKNALSMAFNEGQRNIGLRIQADLISASPRGYLKMLEERSDSDNRSNDRDAFNPDQPGGPLGDE